MRKGCALCMMGLAGSCGRTGLDLDRAESAGATQDTPRVPVDCHALLPLGGRVAALVKPPRELLFGESLGTVVASSRDSELVRIDLPAGTTTALGQRGGKLAWFDQASGEFLALDGDGTLSVVSLTSKPSRPLATQVCAYLLASDRRRVYVARNCANAFGTLEVLDPVGGTSDTIANGAQSSETAVSPDGLSVAFRRRADGSSTELVVAVAPRFDVRVLGPNEPLRQFGFLPDNTLVYERASSSGASAELHRYAPAADADEVLGVDLTLGYEGPAASVPMSVILASDLKSNSYAGPISLYSLDLSGHGSTEIATDVIPFYLYQMPISERGFALSTSGKYAVYASEFCAALAVDGRCTVPLTRALRSVSVRGGTSVKLASTPDMGFRFSPTSDDVALLETEEAKDGGTNETVRVVSAATGSIRLSYVRFGSLDRPTFVPDGRGILFQDQVPAEPNAYRLVYEPLGGDPAPVELARWREGSQAYWLDPEGCLVAHPGEDAQSTVFTAIP